MSPYNEAYARHQEGLLNRLARDRASVISCLSPKSGERILDIGCNTGVLVKKLRTEYGADAIGIDNNPHAVALAQSPYISIMPAEKLMFEDESIDKIICLHTIEHLERPNEAASEMLRATKRGGKIIVMYPVEPIRGITAVASALRAYGNPLQARSLHVNNFSPWEVENLFDKNYVSSISSEERKSDHSFLTAIYRGPGNGTGPQVMPLEETVLHLPGFAKNWAWRQAQFIEAMSKLVAGEVSFIDFGSEMKNAPGGYLIRVAALGFNYLKAKALKN